MPWVVPEKYDFATVDFTPNYLCTEKALKTNSNPKPNPSPQLLTPTPNPNP